MFLKKVLNQPNLVGTVMIALLVCSGFVYAFAFDGFNVETATGGEVEAWLAEASAESSYGTTPEDCVANFNDYCTITHKGKTWTCAKMCVNIGKPQNRCKFCRG